MTRGVKSDIGDTNISANGYHQTKTERGWLGTHILVAEKMLGRQLRNDEYVKFKGSRKDLTPENLQVCIRGTSNARRRLAAIEARIEELQAQADELRAEISLDD